MFNIKSFLKIIKTFKNWESYLLDFWMKKEGDLTYYGRDGAVYPIRALTDDHYILSEICVHDIYTPKGFELNEGDVVLDIGSHIGIFSIYASKKKAKVYSFEPTKANYDRLTSNIEKNNLNNVSLFNLAVSDKKGQASFFVCNEKKFNARHSLYDPGKKSKKIIIQTTTLKEILKENKLSKIDFLKLDCEGAEYDILFNCPKEILSKIGKISMEFHDLDEKRNGKKLKTFLEENGFKVSFNKKLPDILYAKKRKRKYF
jgi:FkbM family methyltransferase